MIAGAYNQFSDAYNKMWLENIDTFRKKLKAEGHDDFYYVDFYPSFGISKEEKTDFLIYGQAVNGWKSGFEHDKLINQNHLSEAIRASNQYHSKLNHNPLDWVNVLWNNSTYEEYGLDEEDKTFYKKEKLRLSSSFFWNITYKLINGYYDFERSSQKWTSKIVWSNLHKISPEDKNPSAHERNLQMELSIQLVQQEIEELKPKFCIVLTNGSWWEPFGKALVKGFTVKENFNSIIHYHGHLDSTKIVVTARPRFANHDLYVTEILKRMKASE